MGIEPIAGKNVYDPRQEMDSSLAQGCWDIAQHHRTGSTLGSWGPKEKVRHGAEVDSYPEARPGGHPRGLLAPKGPDGSGRRTLQAKISAGPWLSKVCCSSAWLPSAGQLTQSIPCLLPVPIYHPTHCRAQSVWPQLS